MDEPLSPPQQIEFFDAADGYRWAARVWRPAKPLGQVVFIHGIISHSGWYLPTCQHLARAGFEVHALDRRGSGLNAANRGDVDRYETWIDDVKDYLDERPHPGLRLLLGISWGGKFATAFARTHPTSLDGLGLLCPGLFSQKFPNRLKYTALAVAASLGLSGVRVTIPLKDPALFTSSLAHQPYVRDDPLTLRKVSIRFALADRELTRFATEAPEEIRVPTLMLLAEHDRVVDNGKLREFYERLGTNEKKLIEYQGATHTLEFEPDPSGYLADLRAWTQPFV